MKFSEYVHIVLLIGLLMIMGLESDCGATYEQFYELTYYRVWPGGQTLITLSSVVGFSQKFQQMFILSSWVKEPLTKLNRCSPKVKAVCLQRGSSSFKLSHYILKRYMRFFRAPYKNRLYLTEIHQQVLLGPSILITLWVLPRK